ncbi:MAG: 1-acyl-sn-glycerol-3-phosphate acyltransferase, partial [Micromonosporaceae bacterium]|nr:1-acyl-sn-glycerol-3-phosphate acyltransferase [Micromonosporaceae bacterium]
MARRRLGLLRRLSVLLVKPWMVVLTSHEWRGSEYFPKQGGAIIAANHLSHFDPFAIAHFIYENGRWPHFLAKASLFRIPVVGRLMFGVQQIPVHRGTADAAKALDAAIEAIRLGKIVIIYPEGTTTRDPDLWPMRGKTGIARLALATGAPVIPVVTWGPQQVFDPRTKQLRLRPGTRMTVVAGPPIDLTRRGSDCQDDPADPAVAFGTLTGMTDHIMLRLTEMLAEVRQSEDDGVQSTRHRS